MHPLLDARPIVVAIAGPNGAGKSTFYEAFLRGSGLRFVNADAIARELGIGAYEAAEVAAAIRRELTAQRESFVFETVLSDPVGEKVGLLRAGADGGQAVVLCFIGVASAAVSEERVAMRVTQGEHDVPAEKLVERFPRTLANLRRAAEALPLVLVFDNTDLADPYRRVAQIEGGETTFRVDPPPPWLADALGDTDEA